MTDTTATDTAATDTADTPAASADSTNVSQPATPQHVTSEHTDKLASTTKPTTTKPSTTETSTTETTTKTAAGDGYTPTVFTVDAAGGKRIAIIASVMLLLMQGLVTLVVLVSQPMSAPDVRAWLFVISSWLLASIVMASVWQIAVFAQQARLRFVETGLEVNRPGILGLFTRRVLLPYDQLRKVRIDLSAYPVSSETTLISDQRSILFDLRRLREQGQRIALTPEHLLSHPLVVAFEARAIPLELRQTPDAPWQPLENDK